MKTSFKTLVVSTPSSHVLHVELNRPRKRNAMSRLVWDELHECFEQIRQNSDCRAVIISGRGDMFTAGLDVQDMSLGSLVFGDETKDVARRSLALKDQIDYLQRGFSIMERLKQPVIAAVHSLCIGAGVDLITACDIRLCTSDAKFSIMEVNVGLAADVGTLQRIGKVMGNQSLVRELAYTGRFMGADEALRHGFVSQVMPHKDALLLSALKLADEIASKSPVAVCGTKHILNHARDHSVQDGLDYVATWNLAMLQTNDTMEALAARMQKRSPIFANL
eukprot:g82567.t1